MNSYQLEITVLNAEGYEIEVYKDVFRAKDTDTAHELAYNQGLVEYPDCFDIETVLIDSF